MARTGTTPGIARFKPFVQRLESRLVLSGDTGIAGLHLDHDPHHADHHHHATPLLIDEPVAADGLVSGDSTSDSTIKFSRKSIPVLNSLPGARVKLYLDFNGHFQRRWGAYQNIRTPAFDQDGDPKTFTRGELDTITQIWQAVAEDFAPFTIDVTTQKPANFRNSKALRVVIGGNSNWAGGKFGGYAYVNSFTNRMPNVVYVFSKNLGHGNPGPTADAVSHESGHAFGLKHQSTYSASGNRVAAYSTGSGGELAPLMGNSYYAARSIWWHGTTTSATKLQDDMAALARQKNRFGYRADDHGDSADMATLMATPDGRVQDAGVIGRSNDRDVFTFFTGAGTIHLAVDVWIGVNNLDVQLELWAGDGESVVAWDAPPDSYGAAITVSVAEGTYYLAVTGSGTYGDVGHYTVSGSIIGSGATATSLPQTLTAEPSFSTDETTGGSGSSAAAAVLGTGSDIDDSADSSPYDVLANSASFLVLPPSKSPHLPLEPYLTGAIAEAVLNPPGKHSIPERTGPRDRDRLASSARVAAPTHPAPFDRPIELIDHLFASVLTNCP